MSKILGEIFATVLVIYLAACAVIVPIIAWEALDCRWHLIPDSILTGDEWRGK